MSAAQYLPPVDRTRAILEDLEAVRENLLALSDDIWAGIDRQDLTAFDEGVRFMRSYVEKMSEFDRLAAELSVLIQQYTQVSLEAAEETGQEDRERNERIIQDLNRDEPHSLDENFTYKRPHGFILVGQAASGITTWQRLYELVCRQLHQRDAGRFGSLVDHPEFISNRGHHSVTHDPNSLRGALQVDQGLFVECNLSANGIRDMLRRLLDAFQIAPISCGSSCARTATRDATSRMANVGGPFRGYSRGSGHLLFDSCKSVSNQGGTILHFGLGILCHGRFHWNEVPQITLDEEPESRLGT